MAPPNAKALALSLPAPDEMEGAEDGEGMADDEAAAQDVLDAIEAKDPAALASAMRALVAAVDAS